MPSWLPKSVLTLGPVSALGTPETCSGPRFSPFGVPFSLGLPHAELWIAQYRRKERSGLVRVFPVEAPILSPWSSGHFCWLLAALPLLGAHGRGEWVAGSGLRPLEGVG